MTVSGTVVDETGQPIVGVPVSLHYATPWSHGFGGAERPTDSQGQIHFEHVNPDLPGKYELIARPTAGFQSRVVEFEPSEQPMRIELEPGRRLEGRVTDVVTGNPLTNVRIEAWPWGHLPGHSSRAVETRTDAQGHFAFDNLADREYMLKVDGTWPEGTTAIEKDRRTSYRTPPGEVNHFRPQEEPVEVRVTSQPQVGP